MGVEVTLKTHCARYLLRKRSPGTSFKAAVFACLLQFSSMAYLFINQSRSRLRGRKRIWSLDHTVICCIRPQNSLKTPRLPELRGYFCPSKGIHPYYFKTTAHDRRQCHRDSSGADDRPFLSIDAITISPSIYSRRLEGPPRFFPTCYPDQQGSLPEEEYADDVHRFEDPSVVFDAASEK